jgi:hypothetical protein
MIKQNWLISEEDKLRIISLHESATKNNYLIFEQNIGSTIKRSEDFDKVVTQKFPISFYFPTGFHSVKSVDEKGGSIVDQVTKSFDSLKEFIRNYDNPKVFNVTISSGESAVPNRDNERLDKSGIGTVLKPGRLAQMRSKTIENLLIPNFQKLIQEGFLDTIPQIVISEPIIGKSTVKDSEDAKKEQFVKVDFDVKGMRKDTPTPEVPCDFNIKIKIEYKPVANSNSRFHCCDFANFSLLLNNIPINVEGTNSSIFSLNNHTDCGARSQVFNIDSETANQILSIKQPIDVGFECKSEKCHEAPMLVSTYKDGKIIEKGKYLGTAKNKADRMLKDTIKVVAQMDKCGKITFVDEESITKLGEYDSK